MDHKLILTVVKFSNGKTQPCSDEHSLIFHSKTWAVSITFVNDDIKPFGGISGHAEDIYSKHK